MTVPAFVLVLSLVAIGAIAIVHERAHTSRTAQLELEHVRTELNQLQSLPFGSVVRPGAPARTTPEIEAIERRIATTLDQLLDDSPPAAIREAPSLLRANFAAVDQIDALTESGQRLLAGPTLEIGVRLYPLLAQLGTTHETVQARLAVAGREYERRAVDSELRATLGTAAAILLLVVGFVLVYRRSVKLAAASHDEARTDALTGLRNRRALIDDLETELPTAGEGRGRVLALFDLDGFKNYNDTFGHPAGDVLLARLGERLQSAMAGVATAYRMGGDEFCVLAPAGAEESARIVALAAEALSEDGDSFEIRSSHGAVLMPEEASSPAEALQLADQRMYERKVEGSSASRQSSDVLLKVLSERNADLSHHVSGVADLAAHTARHLGLPAQEVQRIGLAAALHDVGKTAIPDALLNKPGPLDDDEWQFMRRHTVIGERIILAAPSLAPSAELVRSSHEHFDGSGYPDGLRGDAIPLGARIIAACDAFDAMVSDRPYRAAMTIRDAIAELHRCSGTQFDPAVIAALCELVEDLSLSLACEPDAQPEAVTS